MYNLVIAERNTSYVECLQSIIRENFPECFVEKVVGTSREVIDIIHRFDIDIVIIDVKITGLNGLETVKRIKEFNENVRVIVLSEYDYIEFARQAIRLKVDDYIILPAKEYEITQAINNSLNSVNQIRHYQQKITNVKSEYKELKMYIEHSFIYTIVFSKLSTKEIKKYTEILSLSMRGCMINIEIDGSEVTATRRPSIAQVMYEIIHSKDNEVIHFVVGPKVNRRVVGYISIHQLYIDGLHHKIEGIMKEIADEIYEKLQLTVRFGVGGVDELMNIYTSYQEAIRNLGLRKENALDAVKKDVVSIKGNQYKDLEKKLLTSLRINDGNAIEYLNTMLDCMDEFSDDIKRSRIIELLVLTRHTMESFDWEKSTQVSFVDYLLSISNKPIRELHSWAHQTFEFIQHSLLDQNRMYSKTVWDAIQLIEHNYTRNVTLEEVSKQVGVSSQYLSKIFREETKQTFVEWITNVRITKAKEHILTIDRPIKEVGILVGYKDPNYFSRIFRSVVGKTPSEFKEQVKKKEKDKKN